MARKKSPWAAVLLSLLFPRLGHFCLEEDGLGAYFFIFGYLGFLVPLPLLLWEVAAMWVVAPWLVLGGLAIIALAAADAYRIALRYNRYGGPSRGPAKHIDFVDSANAPITRTSLRPRWRPRASGIARFRAQPLCMGRPVPAAGGLF